MSTNTISLNSCNTWFVYSTQVVCNWETVPLNEKKKYIIRCKLLFLQHVLCWWKRKIFIICIIFPFLDLNFIGKSKKGIARWWMILYSKIQLIDYFFFIQQYIFLPYDLMKCVRHLLHFFMSITLLFCFVCNKCLLYNQFSHNHFISYTL